MPEAEVKAEVKPSVTVVTSENLLEFQNKKIDEKSPPVAAEPEPEGEVKAEVKAEEKKPPEEDEEVKEVRKGNPKIEKRFSELTEARKAAEAKAKAEAEARSKAEQERDALKAKYEAPKIEEDLGPKPTPTQFADVNEYSKALEEWTTENTKRTLVKEQAERAQTERQEKVITTWKERLEAYKKENPDFDKKIANAQVQVSEQVRDAILKSDVGPQILDHLADHPEVGEKIGKLTVGDALVALGRLEAKLEKLEAKEPVIPESKSEVIAEVSKAPAPIAPLRGAGKPVETRVDSQGVYHGTYAQYKKDRAAGKIR